MATIYGIVTKTWPQEGTDRVFATVEYEDGDGLVVGKLGCYSPSIRDGDCFVADGEWKENKSKYQKGRTEMVFEAKMLHSDLPQTTAGAERFLNGIFRAETHGIGPAEVRRFLAAHGAEALRNALEKPDLLVAMSTRAQECAKAIIAAWEDRIKGRRAVNLLESSGLEGQVIDRVMNDLQDEALTSLRANPYSIARIPQVGFVNADRVGAHLGIPKRDRRRLLAAVAEVLRVQMERGSTCADLKTLLAQLSGVSGIDQAILERFLEDASNNRDDHDLAIYAINGSPVCATLDMYKAEGDIVRGVLRLMTQGRRNPLERVEAAAAALFARPEFARFDPVQRLAVTMAASEPISILTGGPGTGKSTVMDAVARLAEQLDGGPLFLVAPTGKAAKRLAQTTKRKTQTVHRLLGAKGRRSKGGAQEFTYGANKMLPAGAVVVVDEASMLDAEVMVALIKALPPDGRLLLVGDRNQLPSVGAGSVLGDLLRAKTEDGRRIIPSVALANVYRTAKDSGIATGAALVCEGKIPDLGPDDRGGVSFTETLPRNIVDEVVRLVCEELPRQGLDPLTDVAVLCPQAPGVAGTWEINRRLSERLNPDGAAISGVRAGPFDDPRMPIPRVGDRIMLTENDADNDVMNGDTGIITGAGRDAKGKTTIKVKFDSGTELEYPATRWRSLILAYAGTIHKSQGSQYKAVIMPMATAHERMLDRTLVYTGWTRAQSRLYLVGEREALEHGITTYRGDERQTMTLPFLSSVRPEAVANDNRPDWEEMSYAAQAACGGGMRPSGRNMRMFRSNAGIAPAITPAPASGGRNLRMFSSPPAAAAQPASPPPPEHPPVAPRVPGRLFGRTPVARSPVSLVPAPEAKAPTPTPPPAEVTTPAPASTGPRVPVRMFGRPAAPATFATKPATPPPPQPVATPVPAPAASTDSSPRGPIRMFARTPAPVVAPVAEPVAPAAPTAPRVPVRMFSRPPAAPAPEPAAEIPCAATAAPPRR